MTLGGTHFETLTNWFSGNWLAGSPAGVQTISPVYFSVSMKPKSIVEVPPYTICTVKTWASKISLYSSRGIKMLRKLKCTYSQESASQSRATSVVAAVIPRQFFYTFISILRSQVWVRSGELQSCLESRCLENSRQ